MHTPDTRPGSGIWRPAALLAVAWLVLWGTHIFRSDYFALATGVQDDTYYYLLPAWNFSRVGWFTFDGLTSSYGFQPLWELCLAILAMLLPSREALLRASLFLGAACYGLTALGIARAAALLWCRAGRSSGAWAATVSALILLVNTPVQTSNLTGKENALYGLLFVLLLNLRLGEHITSRPRFPLLAGVLAGLILLARLTPMSLAVVAIQPLMPTGRWSRFAFTTRYAAAAALTMLPWVVYAMVAFGSPVPTSAFVRTEGLGAYLASGGAGLRASARAVLEYLNACGHFSLGLASNFWDAPHQFDGLGRIAVPFLVLPGLAWVVVAALRHSRGQVMTNKPDAYVVALLGAIVAASAVIPILLSRDTADMYYRRWYIVELPVLAALLAGVGAEVIATAARRVPAVLRAGLVALFLVWLGGAASQTAALGKPSLTYKDQGRWQDVTLRATLWSNRELGLTRDDRVGAFSAGLLAWFSTATVVNLDGLANDEAARAIRAHWSTDRYCAYRGIQVYVDAVEPALLFERYYVRVTFPNSSREFPIYYVADIGSNPRGARSGRE